MKRLFGALVVVVVVGLVAPRAAAVEEYEKEKPTRLNAIHKTFLVYFRKKTPEILRAVKP